MDTYRSIARRQTPTHTGIEVTGSAGSWGFIVSPLLASIYCLRLLSTNGCWGNTLQRGSAVSLPIAQISDSNQLTFECVEKQGLAWDLGVFYLKAPDSLDLAGARQFGQEILDPQSPFRDIPQYGELEGFISL